ncbi:hypothetical protein GCK32_009685 [Trichostrongylus colubriformis]|uniref:Uncharacterized protein n=1 Tax=Trichostrongylus colubriformis TaxID=6319 RepID=A0AAN8EZP9_TRICO
MRVSVITPISSNFRKELQFDVPDDTHILHAQFRCRGHNFAAYNGGPSFPLADCCGSKTLTAGDLISSLPDPANALPVECSIGAARVFAIWTQPDSVALKAQRTMNLDDKFVDPHSLGFAYAVFMNKCAHVSNMARATEPATVMDRCRENVRKYRSGFLNLVVDCEESRLKRVFSEFDDGSNSQSHSSNCFVGVEENGVDDGQKSHSRFLFCGFFDDQN